MKVKLISYMSIDALFHASAASRDLDPTADNISEVSHRIINKHQHHSVFEHSSFNFSLEGASRAFLQEFSRHRLKSITVKSTRYTLNKNIKEILSDKEWRIKIDEYFDMFFTTECLNDNCYSLLKSYFIEILNGIESEELKASNDDLKYIIPEALRTNLVVTYNGRALYNELKLRTAPEALLEYQVYCKKILEEIPNEFKPYFDEFYKVS